ncbi:MAG TPA: PEGA domain-containing protein [Myxococcota bacterium]|jgi:hypothetical protein
MMRLKLSVLLLAAAVGSACSHAVIIDSEPSGAEIKVNGEKVGTGPVTYSETTGWEKVYDIEATKGGFKNTRKEIKQTEWNVPVTAVSVGGGLLCLTVLLPVPLIGLLWAKQLPDKVVIAMDRGANAPTTTDPGTAPPPSSYGY